MGSDNDVDRDEGSPRPTIAAALAEVIMGSQTVELPAFMAAISTSMNDIMGGRRFPSGMHRAAGGIQAKMDEDMWW